MRILLVHERYQRAGGEDAVVAAEYALLASRGHAVTLFEVDHGSLRGVFSRVHAAGRAIWSPASARAVTRALQQRAPDVVHVHNFFPLLSPSVHAACRRAGAAVVQTVHNYRLLCPAATLFRDGRPCEDCVGRAVPWPGLRHGCYRGSRAATAPVAAMIAAHRALGTWARAVDVFVAPTAFVRSKLVEGGLPPARIAVKPHFVPGDPAPGDGRGGFALAVGRLSAEKGFATLVDAWRRVRAPLPLRVAGDGPLRDALAARAAGAAVEWLGDLPAGEVRRLMQAARVLVVPSAWYETFGLVIAEAFAAGLPVVAARHGAPAELVDHGRTGLLFEPGNAAGLAAAVDALAADPARLAAMRRAARAEFEEKYGAARNHALLLDVYARALESARARRSGRAAIAEEEEAPWIP